jgi:inner membrane protease ATP23
MKATPPASPAPSSSSSAAAAAPAAPPRRRRAAPFSAASAPEGLQKTLEGTFSAEAAQAAVQADPALPDKPSPAHPDGFHVENGFFQFRRHMNDAEVCKKRLYAAMTDPTVKFMLEKIRAAGCALPDAFFSCEPFTNQFGGFVPPYVDEETGEKRAAHVAVSMGLGGRSFVQEDMNVTLTHELVHAYDHCRRKLRWDNCAHHACTEVRAANLSGDCKFWREVVGRGQWNHKGQQKECVKRRAMLSVLQNPACPPAKAKVALDMVFERCWEDTSPFEYHP